MLSLIFLLVLSGLVITLYKRYVPVYGVPCMDIEDKPLGEHVTLLDVRDYNMASHQPVRGALHLPYAYLQRHFGEIRSKDIVIVASDRLLLNMSVRFLRQKGFNIVGCYMTGCKKPVDQKLGLSS